MRVGPYRHRIRLQSPAGSRDSVGARVTTWTDVAVVWALVEPLSGRDQFLAAQRQATTSHTVFIRYSTAVSAVAGSWRVVFGTRVLVVDSVINVGERNEKFELSCTEGLRQE